MESAPLWPDRSCICHRGSSTLETLGLAHTRRAHSQIPHPPGALNAPCRSRCDSRRKVFYYKPGLLAKLQSHSAPPLHPISAGAFPTPLPAPVGVWLPEEPQESPRSCWFPSCARADQRRSGTCRRRRFGTQPEDNGRARVEQAADRRRRGRGRNPGRSQATVVATEATQSCRVDPVRRGAGVKPRSAAGMEARRRLALALTLALQSGPDLKVRNRNPPAPKSLQQVPVPGPRP